MADILIDHLKPELIIQEPEVQEIEIQEPEVQLENPPNIKSNEIFDKLFDKEYYNNIFDDETIKYCDFRINKNDPVTCENLDDENSFKFKHIWDCITGERLGIDPYGSLYFSPVTIFRTIINKILLGLWTEIDDCIPFYGENIGVGKNFIIPSRGPQPEKYVFRLPIQDCYLYRNSDKCGKSIHNLGPEFTDEELQEIDMLIKNYWMDDSYIEDLPDPTLKLYDLRKLYDVAIDKLPTNNIEALPTCLREKYLRTLSFGIIDIDHNEFINRIAVEEIKKRIGFRSKSY